MVDDLRQRFHDALADALGECVNCGSPTAAKCICGPYGTAAVLDRLTDAAFGVRDSELEQTKGDALAVVGEAAQERAAARARAEQAETTVAALTWLVAAGVQVTIGACNHQGGADLRVAVDLDDDPAWYGELLDCLADAKTYCSAQGVEP